MSHLAVYLHGCATDPCINSHHSYPYRLLQSHFTDTDLKADRAPTMILSNAFYLVKSHVYARQCFVQSQLNPRRRLKPWQSLSKTWSTNLDLLALVTRYALTQRHVAMRQSREAVEDSTRLSKNLYTTLASLLAEKEEDPSRRL